MTNLPLAELEEVLAEIRPALAGYTPPEAFGPYLRLSEAKLLRVPAGRWDEAERLAEEAVALGVAAASRILWLEVVGGIALRRDDLARARPLIEELRAAALATQEPQRVLPMTALDMAGALVEGDADRVRAAAERGLPAARGVGMDPLAVAGILRILAAGDERDLLDRWMAALAEDLGAAKPRQLQAAWATGRAGQAGAAGDHAGAARELAAAAGELDALGAVAEAAKTRVVLAGTLDRAGDADAAGRARAEAARVLEPIGCVHPL